MHNVMKRYLYLFFLSVLLVSCDQVIFPEPQPPRTDKCVAIPHDLLGIWLDQNNDTLHVFKDHFNYNSEEFRIAGSEYLSDSAVMKIYKGKYFYSRRIMINGEQFWLTYILYANIHEGEMGLYAMDPDNVVNLARLQEITSKVRDIETEEAEYYLFAPKRKHYKKIISDTIFSEMISFRKIN